jgi:hypothetical protein
MWRQVNFVPRVGGRWRVARGNQLDIRIAKDVLHQRDGEPGQSLHEVILLRTFILSIVS